jgi:long-subunit fatty acid transport protein
VGPYVAWRFTDKISAGVGLQYRLSVSVKEAPWVSGQDKVSGLFAFTDIDVFKGIFARVHYEYLTAPVPVNATPGQAEGMEQAWVPGFSLGAGKTYTFYKAIHGYALVQYNLVHEHRKTPYMKPLQAKIGFFILGRNLKK